MSELEILQKCVDEYDEWLREGGNADVVDLLCDSGQALQAAEARIKALLTALDLARRVLQIACGVNAPYIREAFKVIDAAIAKANED